MTGQDKTPQVQPKCKNQTAPSGPFVFCVAMELPTTLQKPAWTFEEFSAVLGLPESTLEDLARQDPAPPFFLLGRRRYILQADALDWLEAMRNAHPWCPRRNSRR